VTEESPTSDQLRSILEYVGEKNASKVVEGASDEADAQRRFRMDVNALKRPLVSYLPTRLSRNCETGRRLADIDNRQLIGMRARSS
jgi:Protein of unknown function (DUF1687)